MNESKPDLVVLAGWMHILSPTFLDLVHAPIINLHPALPGAFDGANAIGRAHEAYQKGEIQKTGAMVHRVVAEVDRGEPLVVREIAMKDETLEQLENRIHEASHQKGKADDRSSMKSLCRERASRSSWP